MAKWKLEDIAGQDRSSWRQRCASHIAQLQSELGQVRERGLSDSDQIIAGMADKHLGAARDAVARRGDLHSLLSGSEVDRAWPNIHKAEAAILRLVPEDELYAWGATVLARAQQHLGEQDPRRSLLTERLEGNEHRLDSEFRDLAVHTLQAANEAADDERAQVRTFRNFVLVSVAALTTLAIAVICWGNIDPAVIPEKMCFYPNNIRTCPAGGGTPSAGDITLVMFVGMCAAALAGAFSLRHIQGTSTPYMVPMVLMLLRLPAGALSAFIGLLLIRGSFVPGLTNLDTSGQILAWAAFFGVAQEAITRMIDDQGNRVLANVRGPMREFGPEKPSADSSEEKSQTSARG
ncbi:hypothetical protein [Streptomyces sp. NPDC053048]|uniref:hypothetical protein n=1 Tax=Streptomyces sp. NPDC053048 TaxID=3365694 RepID=UPI0037D6EFAC